MKILKILITITISAAIVGCSNNRFKIDTKKSDLKIKIERFDKDIFALRADNAAEEIPALQAKYGAFFDLYAEYILAIGSPDSAAFASNLNGFLTDSIIRDIYEESLRVFNDASDIEKKLTTAFKYIEHYFPEKTIPSVYMHVSGFNQQIVAAEDILSASIDNYLGADYVYYQKLADIHSYQLLEMTPEKLPSDYVKGWLLSEFPYNSHSEVLLDNMLYRGKIMFLLETIMPGEKEAVLMGYTPEQLKWCRDNQKLMWTYMAENKHLFSTDRMTLAKYINEAPFTSFFPPESPGRTSIWLGWQIIRSYMKNNKEIGLPELMEQTDYKKILEMSRYRP